jgi:uncharacterized membrane protein YebE (DUF533 family)
MSMQSLLDQLLGSAMGGVGGARPGGQPAGRGESHIGKYATGAAAGGALALLLGSRRGRKVGGKVLKYGTAAAVGAVAWRAYRDWQGRQAASAAAGPSAASAGTAAIPAAVPAAPKAFAQLPAPQIEAHSQAMLKAMIAAAKADGHMDERERELVESELHRLEADPALRTWVDAELKRPVEPAEIAAAASGPEMAAEIYLASALVVDDTTTMERAYLDALAVALKLPAELKADLEARARQGL